MTAIHIIGIVAVFLVLDWAFFERIKLILGSFGDTDEISYRKLPIWRLVLVVIASTTIGIASSSRELLIFPFWAGVALMLASIFLGILLILKR